MMNTSDFFWINAPEQYAAENDCLSLTTEPHTDFWQRTHYGFQNDNGHCYVKNVEGDFSFSLRAQFTYNHKYDQCGVIVYQDSENWCKASIEAENGEYARLGSVVTNLGWSDWATTDIPAGASEMFYRISRRNNDFLLEQSADGSEYHQLRVFHLHAARGAIAAGAYACSPLDSSFSVRFSQFTLSANMWLPE